MRTDEWVVLAAALLLILLRMGTRVDEFGRGVMAITAFLLIALTAASAIFT